MKKLLACVLLAFLASGAFSQKQNWKWYFGDHAGLDFSSGTPVVLTNGSLLTASGCATISDSLGNLQFYTNGVNVWNKNHAVMNNGTGLNGNNSSTQSALIVPKPGSTTFYYIFTVPVQNISISMSYSEVDMTLNGGLGDVVAKNVPLRAPVVDKLTAVLHANGTDFWVICHEQGNNTFAVFPVTSAGVFTTPVISNSGAAQGVAPSHAMGYLKASPNGAKICQAMRSSGYSELFDFNNSTGVISNGLTISGPVDPYGVEFSPDNSKLYISSLNANGEVYQYNLAAGSSSAIAGSGVKISPNIPSHWYGALQLATDGKIYVDQLTKKYIGVIANPNASGSGCGFQDSLLYLGAAGQCQNGLPNFIKKYSGSSTTTTTTSLHSYSNCREADCILVFPNPCKDSFKIQLPNEITGVDVILLNALGQPVLQKKLFQTSNEIITTGLSSGLYSYIVSQDKMQVSTGKLIVE